MKAEALKEQVSGYLTERAAEEDALEAACVAMAVACEFRRVWPSEMQDVVDHALGLMMVRHHRLKQARINREGEQP